MYITFLGDRRGIFPQFWRILLGPLCTRKELNLTHKTIFKKPFYLWENCTFVHCKLNRYYSSTLWTMIVLVYCRISSFKFPTFSNYCQQSWHYDASLQREPLVTNQSINQSINQSTNQSVLSLKIKAGICNATWWSIIKSILGFLDFLTIWIFCNVILWQFLGKFRRGLNIVDL